MAIRSVAATRVVSGFTRIIEHPCVLHARGGVLLFHRPGDITHVVLRRRVEEVGVIDLAWSRRDLHVPRQNPLLDRFVCSPELGRFRFGTREPHERLAVSNFMPYRRIGSYCRIVHGDDRSCDINPHRSRGRVPIVDHDKHRLGCELATIQVGLDVGSGDPAEGFCRLIDPGHDAEKPFTQFVLSLGGLLERDGHLWNVTHLNVERRKNSFVRLARRPDPSSS